MKDPSCRVIASTSEVAQFGYRLRNGVISMGRCNTWAKLVAQSFAVQKLCGFFRAQVPQSLKNPNSALPACGIFKDGKAARLKSESCATCCWTRRNVTPRPPSDVGHPLPRGEGGDPAERENGVRGSCTAGRRTTKLCGIESRTRRALRSPAVRQPASETSVNRRALAAKQVVVCYQSGFDFIR